MAGDRNTWFEKVELHAYRAIGIGTSFSLYSLYSIKGGESLWTVKPVLSSLHTSKYLVQENPAYFMMKNTKETDMTAKLPKDIH